MNPSLALKLKLKKFATGAPIRMTLQQKKELKKYSQDVLRFSVDIDCNDCISEAMRKLVKYQKIK